jgi:hypothetical protein
MDHISQAPGIVPTNSLRFLIGALNPTILQTTSTATETGDALTIQAQNVSGGTTSVGGKLTLQSGSGTLTGALNASAGQIEFKQGSTSLGTYNLANSGDFRFNLGSGLPYFVFAANGAGQLIDFQATQGQVIFDSPTAAFRDATSANTLTLSLNSTGNTNLTFGQGTSVGWTQSTRTSDAATKNYTFTTQAPFASATGTNRNSGTFIFTSPAPVAGGDYGSWVRRYGTFNTQTVSIGYKVTTTNSTPTNGFVFTPQLDSCSFADCKITARDQTNGLNNVYHLKAAVRRNGSGNATLIGTAEQTFVREEAAGWDAVLDVSGTDLIVILTGAASANVIWFIELIVQTNSN